MAGTIYTRLEERIREAHDCLTGNGGLLGFDDLGREYESFRVRFGPEKLAALSRPDLLRVMTPGGGDSLPDWLESEGNKEHRAFGDPQISRGHGLGLWFDEAAHSWYRAGRETDFIRDPCARLRLTPEEASRLARTWRDQLARGVELVAALPEVAGDAVYLRLECDLEAAAPDLVREPWVHKYLNMTHPDLLSQIHSPQEERYLLLRCLEMPPRKKGDEFPAYTCGGRFSRMARELRMPMNHLCLSLHYLFSRPRNYWMLETSEKEWNTFTSQGFIDLGWPLLGDLDVGSRARSHLWEETLWDKLEKFYPGGPCSHAVSELRWMVRLASVRSVIVAHQRGRVIGLAEITGPYRYEGSSDHPHRLPLKRLKAKTTALNLEPPPHCPIQDLRSHPEVVLAVEEALAEEELP